MGESSGNSAGCGGAHGRHTGVSSGGDCSEVLDRMFVFLDNELDQASCAEIQQHLDDCGPCLAKYSLERTVKRLVARSCSEVAPEGLRERVRLSIQQIQIQVRREG